MKITLEVIPCWERMPEEKDSVKDLVVWAFSNGSFQYMRYDFDWKKAISVPVAWHRPFLDEALASLQPPKKQNL